MDGEVSEIDRDATMELQLWPEIRAMLVAELAILVQRFPSFTTTTQIS
jgi:hypothetical protein